MADERKQIDFSLDIADNPEEVEAAEAEANAAALIDKITTQQNVWNYGKVGQTALQASMTLLSTKHGMYAKVPLLCKRENCFYKNTCQLIGHDLAPLGQPCPLEAAQIQLRLVEYNKDFDYDASSFTDKNMINEIINLDILLERCKSIMAQEQTLIVDVITGISEDGTEYTHPEISKAYELYEKILEKRNKMYDLMLATRKSKRGLEVSNDKIATLMDRIRDLGITVEGEFSETN